jgi:hypothetical protein
MTPQKKWNAANPQKTREAARRQDAKRLRVTLSFYTDRPEEMELLAWLTSGNASGPAAVMNILKKAKGEV